MDPDEKDRPKRKMRTETKPTAVKYVLVKTIPLYPKNTMEYACASIPAHQMNILEIRAIEMKCISCFFFILIINTSRMPIKIVVRWSRMVAVL